MIRGSFWNRIHGQTCLSARLRVGCAALLVSTGWGHFAHAQTIGPIIHEPDDVPGRRVIPEYAPIGYNLAGFDVLPAVTFGTRFDNNVFTRTSVKVSDLVLQAEPRIRVHLENRLENVSFQGSLRTSTYLKLHDQDATEYRLEGTYTRGTLTPNSLTVNLGYRREAIQRGTVENDLADGEPLMRRVLHGSLTARKQFNRVSIDAQALVVRQRYERVDDPSFTIIDQNFRNVDRYGVHGLVTFEISGRTSAFSSLEYDRFDYAFSPLLNNRDAENWSGTAGLRYEITRVLYAQLGVGYRRYDFTDAALGAIKGFAVSGHLRYFPSRVLAIRGSIEQNNTTSPYDLVGAVTLTAARIEVEYEMRRSLSWLGTAKFTLEDYAKRPYAARRLEIAGGPRLRFNRWLSADASISYAKRFVSGSAPFEPYSQFCGMLSVTFAR
ncbi:outer membrane beta-barrel protein [Novosphingobium resinovorum]|uniref:outer membrane beta-barrel protein n=1 Tax=Novosphingobium resinovorum TaxID=158500 RepID=UPI002ED0F8A6|nr:outer membrane beta-barrel protein [Novosphingobium resinovorum]